MTQATKVRVALAAIVLICAVAAALWVHTPEKRAEKAFDLLGILVATLVGGWAGGAAAFGAERKTREKAEERALLAGEKAACASRLSAANRAFFTLATIHNAVANLHQFFVQPHRNDPLRALTMDSPQPGMMLPVAFNFDEMSYLLDQPGDVSAQALMELRILEWHYHVILNTGEQRSSAVDELRRAMHATGMASPNPASLQAAHGLLYARASMLTSQFIEVVEEGLKIGKRADTELRKALSREFRPDDLLQVGLALT